MDPKLFDNYDLSRWYLGRILTDIYAYRMDGMPVLESLVAKIGSMDPVYTPDDSDYYRIVYALVQDGTLVDIYEPPFGDSGEVAF